LIPASVSALVMIVLICPRKKRARSGRTAPGRASSASTARRSSALLMRLLGRYCEYSKVRSGSVMRSSQTFLPRSSSRGREQKSSSQTGEVGTAASEDGEGGASAAGADAAAASVSGDAAAQANTPRRRRRRLDESAAAAADTAAAAAGRWIACDGCCC
jgi:hypothetical protein